MTPAYCLPLHAGAMPILRVVAKIRRGGANPGIPRRSASSQTLILPDGQLPPLPGVVLAEQRGLSLTTPPSAQAQMPCSRQRIPGESLQLIEKMTANSQTQHSLPGPVVFRTSPIPQPPCPLVNVFQCLATTVEHCKSLGSAT